MSPAASPDQGGTEASTSTLTVQSMQIHEDVEMSDAALVQERTRLSPVKIEHDELGIALDGRTGTSQSPSDEEGEPDEEDGEREGEVEAEDAVQGEDKVTAHLLQVSRKIRKPPRKKRWTSITPAQKRKDKEKRSAAAAQHAAAMGGRGSGSLESTPTASPGPSEWGELEREDSKELGIGPSSSLAANGRPVLSNVMGRSGLAATGSGPNSPLLASGFPSSSRAQGHIIPDPSVEAGPPTVLPTTQPLSAPFAAYQAPGPRNFDEEEDEEARANAAALARRRAMMKNRAGGGGANAAAEAQEDDETDDRLYCVCKKLYDAERTMIACDKCENWYHLECVHIPDYMVELVDWFFCPPCTEAYGKHTTWKARCARPTCPRAVAPLSKFCSDFCGIEMASVRIEAAKTDPERYWTYVAGARKRCAQVLHVDSPVPGGDPTIMPEEEDDREEESSMRGKKWNSALDEESLQRQNEEDRFVRAELDTKLDEVERRREVLLREKGLIDKRLVYLQIAISRWEALCQATADALAQEGNEGNEGNNDVPAHPPTGDKQEEVSTPNPSTTDAPAQSKKRSNKGKGSKANRPKKPILAINLPEAQCGFDSRIVLDDPVWEEWIETDEARKVFEKVEADALARTEGGATTPTTGASLMGLDEDELQNVCMWPRKECPRHQAWQKVREADFQVERAVLERRLDRLALQESRLRAQSSDHAEAVAFRSYCRQNKPIAPLSVSDLVVTPVKRTSSKNRLARSLVTGEDPFPEASKNPYELFPGLERIEERPAPTVSNAKQGGQKKDIFEIVQDGGKGKRVKVVKKR
ncbi:BZ3500_MvSof-1268-A1-R1_Chr1-2g01312 [Microbotryum saponariae]|uniref:CXXC-type zinc finger protein 1 n=1 Tax=Microbotryum saponariae TaxID=289078 RepID=A0A2X0KT24_9BASI|nr:BZ3500_MvSof-1268-A1-R1_Chr1-2g01312 [Microbotryum saponariae]SCZ97062.1 BZ3501_MvSof-1269-A2-R1_Chr1-2g00911 [Microbotryum saponariae]